MGERVSAWAVSEALGKPRRKVREEWLRWGILREAGPDGLWDSDELARVAHAKSLEGPARRLSRRALVLHGDGFRVETAIRRLAVADVLRRMTRARHKIAQVLWEQRALRGTMGAPSRGTQLLLTLELPSKELARVPMAASDGVFDHWYQSADQISRVLGTAGRAREIPLGDDIPYEERLAIVLTAQLLEDNYVRNRLGLSTKPPRYGPPTDAQQRSADAPGQRRQLPPKRQP
jgi:hypothetical protein